MKTKQIPSMNSKYHKMILNKIEKTFNKTYTGVKSIFRDSKSDFLKIQAVRAWNPPKLGNSAKLAQFRQYWLPCLVGGFNTLTARTFRNL